jgi:hypothetical protein
LPESQGAVGNREFGSDCEPATPQIEQQLAPGLGALADSIGEPDKFLFAFSRRTNNDQEALSIVLEPSLDVNAVNPEVNVAFGG